MRRALVPLLGLVMLVLGCSATGPRFEPTADPVNGQALLYIYRISGGSFGARTAVFEVDRMRVASLKNNGYTVIKLSPGTYEVRQIWDGWAGDDKALDKPTRTQVTLAPNSQTYVRLATSAASERTPTGSRYLLRWHLGQVSPDRALVEMAETRRVEPEAVSVK